MRREHHPATIACERPARLARLTVVNRAANGPSGVIQELHLSDYVGRPPALLAPSSNLIGTIDASITAGDRHRYPATSESWICDAPLEAVQRIERPKPQLRAKDLIAELDSINTQIHRIMFQVERAVAKLATNAI